MTESQSNTDSRIPPQQSQRDELRRAAAQYVRENAVRPPLDMGALESHTRQVLAISGLDAKYSDYAAVLLNNEIWRPLLAKVPYSRRLLLLPQCLRNITLCQAPVDELGLACRRCGGCVIGEFSRRAEQLGYIVLVAEGSALVMSLIAAGRVGAIVGVSCLSVLEKVFPYMQAAGVPGLAIPLLRDGCVGTDVDAQWVYEAIGIGHDEDQGMNLEPLQQEVCKFFELAALERLLALDDRQVHHLAIEWLARSGKRWRPFLSACVFRFLSGRADQPLPEDFRRIAVAVECFHKASLIHDDIEDNDHFRYGQKTLHEQYGVPVALNVGDLLLGLGYKMIASCNAPAAQKAQMLQAASGGHCELCAGQGAELAWSSKPEVLSVEQVLDIFRRKTSPAFEVALSLGALYAGADGEVLGPLGRFSQALGVAYQISDDLDDLDGADGPDGLNERPSILLALASRCAHGVQQELLRKVWLGLVPRDKAWPQVRVALEQLDVREQAARLLDLHRNQALAALAQLPHRPLQELLRQVLDRIFAHSRVAGEVLICCDEHRKSNAAVSRAGKPAVT